MPCDGILDVSFSTCFCCFDGHLHGAAFCAHHHPPPLRCKIAHFKSLSRSTVFPHLSIPGSPCSSSTTDDDDSLSPSSFIGNRISLISKRNIRYEGTLYSINEADATVTLQNVRSFGTEDREQLDGSGEGRAVPAQPDTIHPYLVFRGCDIKDLHVHETATGAVKETDSTPSTERTTSDAAATNSESSTNGAAAEEPAPATERQTRRQSSSDAKAETGTTETSRTKETTATTPKTDASANTTTSKRPKSTDNTTRTTATSKSKTNRNNGNGGSRANGRRNNQVGTGASLLHKKERGYDGSQVPTGKDFDFESNNAKFDDEDVLDDENAVEQSYAKDDFFDSISCDALDKEHGIDNRLRGKEERSKNTETFGAVALNTNNNYYRRNRRGGGRGRGRGRGRYGGRGGGRYHRSRRNNNRNNNNNNATPSMATDPS